MLMQYRRIGSLMGTRRSFNKKASHPKLLEQVENVLPFRDQYPDWCPNYFDTEEVMEHMHISFISNMPDRSDLTLPTLGKFLLPMTKSSTYRMMTIELSDSVLMYRDLSDFDIQKPIW